ncbi:MAG: hypothetical protein ABI307_07455 [Mycobacterium sp.]
MPNPPEPDHNNTSKPTKKPTPPVGGRDQNEPVVGTEPGSDAVTEIFSTDTLAGESAPAPKPPRQQLPERRFTAPGFDAGSTEVMPMVPEAATEVIGTRRARGAEPGKAVPQQILPRLGGRLPTVNRSWGWVLALILTILTLAVIAVLSTLWLTRDSRHDASQEDRVRGTIENFDVAVQNGDLATLRSITCGDVRDRYVNYDQQVWDETYRRIAAAKQYPVVANIDEVVVNDGHAEANVTAFMAFAPRVRSVRSFDLQYRDDQWKICQSHGG